MTASASNLAPHPNVHGLGARLRAWRESNGFDLDAASRLLGVSDNYLYTVERGIHAANEPLRQRFEELVVGLSVFVAPAIMRRIPVLSWVQAGRVTSYEEMPVGWSDWLDCVCPDPAAFALRIVGDSMLYKYPAGGLAVVMPSYPPKNFGLAVAKTLEGETTFKTVNFRGKQPASFRLIPMNRKFPILTIKRVDLAWIYPVHSVVGNAETT